uniref:CCHC-type domain-containing protein n=1 Tax=Trichogramma kaykai TaxID=54128 RepID=A0ABD2WAN2_9HYME
MDGVRSQLEILTESSTGSVNYESSIFKLNHTLKNKRIFDVATGVEDMPAGGDENASVLAWKTKDLEAQTLIGLNCSRAISRKIAKCTSARQMLDKLETLYGKKSAVSIEGLQRLFFGYKYDEKKTVIENCMQIQEYADNLTAAGEEVKESWIMQRILSILPAKLYHFRTSWDNVSGVDRCLTTMFDRLRLEDDRLKDDDENPDNHSQNELISKQVSRSKTSNANKSFECFKCGKKGHKKAECRGKPCSKFIEYCKNTYGCKVCKRKGHFAKDCPEKECSQDNKSDVKSHDKDFRHACISISLSAQSLKNDMTDDLKNSWFQDCGASEHMSSHREWFHNYQKLNKPCLITVGDGNKIKGIGFGDINVEAYNGQEWNKIVLKNVLTCQKYHSISSL